MRDPKRIPEFTNEIAELWQENCPDWRFGQLISNFLSWYGSDPFYMEEDYFLEKFKEFMECV